ncbi:hypothetical protein RRG08_006174 [Elysia crispata]|uniref:Uncharacterized protein n=1 Tax=Elysia crispata TaxID=231223 RepID=A0AAE0ZGK2_9GAST|nr:hypothetical protein RRG08_006174 [Elysia crispata]
MVDKWFRASHYNERLGSVWSISGFVPLTIMSVWGFYDRATAGRLTILLVCDSIKSNAALHTSVPCSGDMPGRKGQSHQENGVSKTERSRVKLSEISNSNSRDMRNLHEQQEGSVTPGEWAVKDGEVKSQTVGDQ